MAEPKKRTKTRPTWSDVKARISTFETAGLVQLVADLYQFNKANQTFLHARFRLGQDSLEEYKKRIAAALAPDITGRRNATISVATVWP